MSKSDPLGERKSVNIAHVPQFQAQLEPFENYIDRLTAFFEVNKVPNNEKVSTLIVVIGAKLYAVLKNNLLPEGPTDKRYFELVEVLKKHYSPKVLIPLEKLKFNRRSQSHTESIAEFILALKQMATTCNYGQFLDQALRDRLIAGLSEESLIKKLLAEPTEMSFAQACKICLDYETVSMEFKLVKSEGLIQEVSKINKMKNQRSQRNAKGAKAKSKVQGPGNKGNCTRCGRSQHEAKDCPAWKQQWICFQCGNKGHVSTVCRSKSKVQAIQQEEEDQSGVVKSIECVTGSVSLISNPE